MFSIHSQNPARKQPPACIMNGWIWRNAASLIAHTIYKIREKPPFDMFCWKCAIVVCGKLYKMWRGWHRDFGDGKESGWPSSGWWAWGGLLGAEQLLPKGDLTWDEKESLLRSVWGDLGLRVSWLLALRSPLFQNLLSPGTNDAQTPDCSQPADSLSKGQIPSCDKTQVSKGGVAFTDNWRPCCIAETD